MNISNNRDRSRSPDRKSNINNNNVDRPVFLSKKERIMLARKKEEEEKELEKKKNKENLKSRQSFFKIKEREREKERERRGRYSREKSREEKKKREQEQLEEKRKYQIKEMYLGKKKEKKKIIPPSQKFRFNFDWEPEDDTTANDVNPLYSKKHQVQFDFGRGFIAGVDRIEQRKKNKFYEELIDKRITEGIVKTPQIEENKIEKRLERNKQLKEDKILSTKHWKDKSLTEMTERDWRILKEDFNITTRGGRVPNPLRYWEEADIPQFLMKIITKQYQTPMPVQRQTIPIGLNNRDLIGVAETGSGKTLAFLIPMISYINKLPLLDNISALDGPYAIVLAPTRELATQSYIECQKLTEGTSIRTICIVGGFSIEEQAFNMRQGTEIIIATPGRLADCLNTRYLVLNQCNYIVLDEADRMLDMGFEPQVKMILDAMPSSNLRPLSSDTEEESKIYRQTIMFSATMPTQVEQLARKYLRNPAYISIGDTTGSAVSTITQRVIFCSVNSKRSQIISLLSSAKPPIIIFCNSRKDCDGLSRFLYDKFSIITIHGGKSQILREQALNKFKQGDYNILIATDVAGRGIDVEGVTLVVNYDCPKTIEAYAHRIGRTGRAGRQGLAVTLITEADKDIFYDLKSYLIKSGQNVPSELKEHESAQVAPGSVDKKRSTVVFARTD